MLKIKLARFGKKGQPHYRIVVNEARDKRDGKYVANVGHYAPTQQPKVLEVDLKAFDEWIQKGAQPTETVAALVARFKSGNPFPPKKAKLSAKAKAKLAAEKEAEEAPVEEKPAAKPVSPEETQTPEEKAEPATAEETEK